MKYKIGFVFLFLLIVLFSCGIPTICKLDGISIRKESSSDEKTANFSVSGSNSDLSLLLSGPGLFLSYIPSSSQSFTDTSSVKNAFSKNVVNKVRIEDNNAVLEYGSSDEKTVLYAFRNEDGTALSSPLYCLDLGKYVSGNNLSTGNLSLSYNEEEKKFSLENNKFIINDDVTDEYIHVFAVFSAENGEFTNIFWSNLTYIGFIKL